MPVAQYPGYGYTVKKYPGAGTGTTFVFTHYSTYVYQVQHIAYEYPELELLSTLEDFRSRTWSFCMLFKTSEPRLETFHTRKSKCLLYDDVNVLTHDPRLTEKTHDDQAHHEQEHTVRPPTQGTAAAPVGAVGR